MNMGISLIVFSWSEIKKDEDYFGPLDANGDNSEKRTR